MAVSRLAVLGLCLAVLAAKAHGGEAKRAFFQLFPVGVVEKQGGTTCLKIADEYVKALKGLDGFSHVIVLYWFDRNDTPAKRRILEVHPRGDRSNPLTGVFACRAPVRPNLIALSVCRILTVEGNTVRVDKIDAFDRTPILDLKPYIPAIDSPERVTLPGWLKR